MTLAEQLWNQNREDLQDFGLRLRVGLFDAVEESVDDVLLEVPAHLLLELPLQVDQRFGVEVQAARL